MKKAILFFVALMFTAGVNAAILDLNLNGSTNASQAIGLDNDSLVTGSGVVATSTWDSSFLLTTDSDTSARIEWSFNPEVLLVGATLEFGEVGSAATHSVMSLTDYVTSVFLEVGKTYFVNFTNATSRGEYDVSVNAVPVPAALLLFAPALLGFFGLRRKATLAA